jgi:hypothetical protein
LFKAMREDGLGIGCYRWNGEYYFWLVEPDFDPSHNTTLAQVTCGCYPG